jgi:hypothetical protein
MKVKMPAACKLKIIFGCCCLLQMHTSVAQLTANTTFESIGYYYKIPQAFSERLSATSKFRPVGGDWRTAIMPSVVLLKNQERIIAGSILQLAAGTVYEIELSVIDSAAGNTPVVHAGNFTTKADVLPPATADTLWVAPNGGGNVYTQLQPGKIENLFVVNSTPGPDRNKINTATTIMCKEGTYYTGGLSYTLNNVNKYTNNMGVVNTGLLRDKPMKIVGEAGKKIIFDGRDTSVRSVTWQLYDATNKIYRAFLPPATALSTEFLMDSVRLYPYPYVYINYFFGIPWIECLYNLRSGDGFYRNGADFLVKTSDGKSPAGRNLVVSKQSNLLSIINTTSGPYVNQAFLFQNIGIQHYSKPIIAIPGDYESIINAEAVKCLNTQDLLFDNCRFESNTYSISINGNADNTIIQNCRFADKTGSYSHGDYKNTANYNNFPPGPNAFVNDNGKHGRNLELSPVFFSHDDYRSNRLSSKNIVFRNNIVDGFVDGFSGRQIDTLFYYDVDVYGNTFRNNYQGVSALGNNINYRLWNNKIKNCPVGIAFYESPKGPFYIFRNEISNLRDRQNITGTVELLTYIDGQVMPLTERKTWGTMFKANASATPNRQLEIHFYHNTILAKDTAAFCLYLWETNWKKIRTANNNFYSKFTNLRFDNINTGKEYNYMGQWDNYFSEVNRVGELTRTHNDAASHKRTGSLTEVTDYLRLYSRETDTACLYVKGTVANPLFLDDALGNYSLANNSPLINRGLIIPNISDLPGVNYKDSLPDIGAYEYDSTQVYVFTGNGNWDVPANWKDNRMPPQVVQNNVQIIIDPVAGGQCILNVPQWVKADSQIKVLTGKSFKIQGNLQLVR